MREYIMMIIGVSLICGVVKILSKNSRELSFAVKIVLVCVIVAPMMKLSADYLVNDDFFVINENEEHTITNEDADFLWRQFTAKTTAEKLSAELEEKIYDAYRIKTDVAVPWHLEGENVVFSVIEIIADCDERKCESIETWVRLNYSLNSVCRSGDVNDTNTEK